MALSCCSWTAVQHTQNAEGELNAIHAKFTVKMLPPRLPPNVTSLIQPMDHGPIEITKRWYRCVNFFHFIVNIRTCTILNRMNLAYRRKLLETLL